MSVPRTFAVALLPGLVAVLAPGPVAAAEAVSTERFEVQGVAVRFNLEKIGSAVDSKRLAVDVQVSDAKSGDPFRGVNPLAWGFKSDANQTLTDLGCKSHIQSFVQGGLTTAPDIDLNSFRLVLLNHDATVSFINPGVSVGGSKLESLITLPGPGADMVLSKDNRFLFISIPERNIVALIDVPERKLVANIEMASDAHPTRLAIDNGGTRAWISLASGGIAVVDPADPGKVQFVKTGEGLHSFAFPADSLSAYVTDSGSNQVSIINVQSLQKIASVATGKTPVDIAYGPQRRALYVSNLNDNSLTVIDADTNRIADSIVTERGAIKVKFDEQGRFGVLLNGQSNRIGVLDSSSNRIVAQSDPDKGEPDQVMFSGSFAYVHELKSPKISVYPLEELRKGNFAPVRIETGTHEPLEAMNGMLGNAMTVAPDGTSAFLINPAEQELFYYVEGMMVPMGSLSTYARSARSIAILNQGLKETKPGHYTTSTEVDAAGTYNFAVLIDKPRFVHCFTAKVNGVEAKTERKPKLSVTADVVLLSEPAMQGSPATIGLRLLDRSTQAPLDTLHDVYAMAHGLSGSWFRKQKLKVGEDGIYRATWVFPSAGVYQILVRIPSRGLGWVDLHDNYVRVEARSASGTRP
jgi:YVTN family beta-propeller protein